ncbi:glycoside hydrolase family 75 protein [Streptomyces sp. NPDC020412]|uniref:glycoside hydrolase family 75 protein n=1 Tax=Streptomyces sp. NPDC020412 TaxID=3365073 RepID=UPI0037BD5EE8
MHSRPIALTAAFAAALLAAAAPGPRASAGVPQPSHGDARGGESREARAVRATLTAAARDTGAVRAARSAGEAREGAVSAAELLAKVRDCTPISRGSYRKDAGAEATVPVCGTDEVVHWTADMDVSCDGQSTPRCNARTDPWFIEDTAFRQSDGKPLNAETLPYVVVPGPSQTWRHTESGVRGGTVVAVVHDDRVRYGVVGDTGPTDVIGEVSQAMAGSLGVDDDPVAGGVASDVTYVLFRDSKATPIEDHSAAASLGGELARRFVSGTG